MSVPKKNFGQSANVVILVVPMNRNQRMRDEGKIGNKKMLYLTFMSISNHENNAPTQLYKYMYIYIYTLYIYI